MADLNVQIAQALSHQRAGRLAQAEALLRRLLQRNPGHPGANRAYASLLSQQGRIEQAAFHLQRAIKAAPADASLTVALAKLRRGAGDLAGAWTLLEEALDRRPDDPDLCWEMGLLLWLVGRVPEAVECYNRGLNRHPNHLELRTSRCFTLNYDWTASAEDVFHAHGELGRAVDRVVSAPPPRVADDRDPQRRLRVGYLSADFRKQSVAFFIESALAAHDRDQFEIFCYHTDERQDDITARIRSYDLKFRDLARLDPASRAEAIRRDRLDLLVELSGLSEGHSLPAVALRPAPVQITYCGYPNTTGLSAIGHRLVDEWTDPAPRADALATERLERIAGGFLCYRPPEGAPEPARLTGRDGVTFGSFNLAPKISEPTVRAWAKILQAVPGSTLLLKSLPFKYAEAREVCWKRFEAAGIERERVEIVGTVPAMADHLAMYSRVDVGLDPFPYNGTTTTCEALWMGVPVITVVGEAHASRVGMSLMNMAGLPELIAADLDDYVARAVALAGDPDRIDQYRRTLRARLAASRLCDADAFTRALEDAYRRIWRNYVEARA